MKTEDTLGKEVVGEAWRKEFDKLLLSRKLDSSSSAIGIAAQSPTEQNVRTAYGMISDYITFMPVGNKDNAERKKILARLDKIGYILYGNKSDKTTLGYMKEFKMGLQYVRQGPHVIAVLTQLPNLVNELRSTLMNASDFAVQSGLRIVLTEKKSKGMTKLDDEEGYEEG